MASQSGESDDDNDSALDEDLEALRRACILTGSTLNDRATSSGVAATSGAASDADSEGIDDLELVRNIQKRFSIPSEDVPAPLSLKPLSFLPPAVSDEDEDDFEILRAIQKRFSAYHEGEYLTALFRLCLFVWFELSNAIVILVLVLLEWTEQGY